MSNLLSKEHSLYLLQHAQNPVHWHAWNENSLQKAMDNNKLLLISIGYSACHWCHVMEHETFEDASVAEIMNHHFINIKVDREERPDVDAIYMKAVQMMTGHGGWPLNVVCLPDGRPVWGGTYFKKDVWINTLEQLAELYILSPEKVEAYAEKLHEGLLYQPFDDLEIKSDFQIEKLELLLEKWVKSFDHEYGGYSRAPKFMMPTNLEFLQTYGAVYKIESILKHVDLTLTRMAWGGIFDTLGGGFSRYSVDIKWHVPHFEKMLYDNGQLLSVYAKAYQRTQNPIYQNILFQTIECIKGNFLNEFGGLSSALDADSINNQGFSEEGSFYVWTKEELLEILGETFAVFSHVYNVNEFGHWEHGNYVLIQSKPLVELAKDCNLSENELTDILERAKKLLFEVRENRVKPSLDTKCLTSWNAMTLIGLIDNYKATRRMSDMELIKNVSLFIQNNLTDEQNILFHTFQNGKAFIIGFLEDYAFVIKAWISMYEITLNEAWLWEAKRWTMNCLDHFYDAEKGFFTFNSRLEKKLIVPHFDLEDNVIPASNSAMAENLYHLSIYFENSHFEKVFLKMLEKILPTIDYASAYSNWLCLYLKISKPHQIITVSGLQAENLYFEITKLYLPNILVVAHTHTTELPLLKHLNGNKQTIITFCEGTTCSQPMKNIEELKVFLQNTL